MVSTLFLTSHPVCLYPIIFSSNHGHFEALLNRPEVWSMLPAFPDKGQIALQAEGSEVEFRFVSIYLLEII